MTLGQKIKELRESNGMFQRQLASILEIGDGFLSKVESDQKPLKREHLKTLSKTFNYSFTELETLWIGSKVYDIVKDEKEGMNALKVAEEQMKYEKK
ncbi:MAG: helix-turn-helix domain-containing protein [Flavobacteriaceae bacterium]|nr:MAG: helix-turn-helix domain-containing protein [Flavobacteriaceae bacterium]